LNQCPILLSVIDVNLQTDWTQRFVNGIWWVL